MFEFEGKKYKEAEGLCMECAFSDEKDKCERVQEVWNCCEGDLKIAVEVKDEQL